MSIQIWGYIAAVLTTGALLPQAIKVIKSRKTKQLSILMLLMQVSGGALWVVYGIDIQSMSIILANAIGASLSAIILSVKLWNKFKQSES